jgi:hypothetical protein
MSTKKELREALKAKEPRKPKAKQPKPLQERMAGILRGDNKKYHV